MRRRFGFHRISGRGLKFRGPRDPASRLAYAMTGLAFIGLFTALVIFDWPSQDTLPRNNPLIELVTQEQEAVLMMSLFFFLMAVLIFYLKYKKN